MARPTRHDERGQPLPADKQVMSAFADSHKIRAVADTLEDEALELRSLQSSPAGGRIDDQIVSDLLVKAKHIREYCTPYALCPACEAKRIGKCKACHDRGWMPRSAWKIWKAST